ncbi:hypothetical protein RHCRD62_90139 [Rhodococcus sp. RD6.2]|nr:hypothetical protein RHCRD62_90139 [Rhodococcus sp. RD6.2]
MDGRREQQRRRTGSGAERPVLHGRDPDSRSARSHRHHPHPARRHRDARVHRGRHQRHREGGAAGNHPRGGRAGSAGQRLPPVPAAGSRRRRRGGRSGPVHELVGADVHRQRRLPGDVARCRVQEGARDGSRGRAVRRRHRRGQGTARARRRRRGHVQVPPRRFPASVHPRGVHGHPASAWRRHHLRVRRTDHTVQHPRLPGGVGAADAGVGGAVHRRTRTPHRAAHSPAVPGAVRRRAGRAVRGPAQAGVPRTGVDRRRDGPRLRRLRHRRRAGEAEPRHHRPLVQRGTARAQAAAPARHQRTRRPVHRDRERRRYLRLRQPVPGRPQRRDLHGERPVQHQHQPVQAGLRPDRRELRLLHLPQLLARVHPPPVQGEGDARFDARDHPQRAVHHSPRRPDPRQHRRRVLRRPALADAQQLLRHRPRLTVAGVRSAPQGGYDRRHDDQQRRRRR